MSITAERIKSTKSTSEVREMALKLLHAYSQVNEQLSIANLTTDSFKSQISAYKTEIKEVNDREASLNAFVETLMKEKENFETKINEQMKINQKQNDEIEIYKLSVSSLEEKNRLLSQLLSDPDSTKITQLEDQIKQQKEDEESLMAAFEEERRELQNKIQNLEEKQGKDQSSDIDSLITAFEEEKSGMESKIKELEQKLRDNNADSLIAAFTAEKMKSEERINDLINENRILKEEAKKNNEEHPDLFKAITQKKGQFMKFFDKSNNEPTERIKILESENKNLGAKIERYKEVLEKTKRDIQIKDSEQTKKINELQKEAEIEKNSQAEKEALIQKLRLEIAQISKESENSLKENNNLKREIESIKKYYKEEESNKNTQQTQEIEKQNEEMRKLLEKTNEEKEELVQKMNKILEETKKQLEESHNNEEKLKKEELKLNEQISKLSSEKSDLTKDLQNKIASMTESLSNERNETSKKEKEIMELSEKIDVLTEEKNSLEKKMNEKAEEKEFIKTEVGSEQEELIKSLRKQIKSFEEKSINDNARLINEINQLKRNQSNKESELTAALEKVAKLEEENSSLNINIEELSKQQNSKEEIRRLTYLLEEEKQTYSKELEAKDEEANSMLFAFEEERTSLEKKLNYLEVQFCTLRETLKKSDEKINELSKENRLLKDNSNSQLKSIIEQKEEAERNLKNSTESTNSIIQSFTDHKTNSEMIINSLLQEKKKLEEEVSKLSPLLEESQRLRKCDTEITQLKQQNSQLKYALKAKEEEAKSLYISFKDINIKNEEKIKHLLLEKKAMTEMNAAIQSELSDKTRKLLETSHMLQSEHDLQKQKNEIQQELIKFKELSSTLEDELNHLKFSSKSTEESLKLSESQNEKLEKMVSYLKKVTEDKEEENEKLHKELKLNIDKINQENTQKIVQVEQERSKLQLDLKDISTTLKSLQETCDSQKEIIKRMEEEKMISSANSQQEIDKLHHSLSQLNSEYSILSDESQISTKELQEKIYSLTEKLENSESERSELTNRITELGGDINIDTEDKTVDKDFLISKLKILVQRSVKVDQNRQKTISKLEEKIKSLEIYSNSNEIGEIYTNEASNREINSLQARIRELELMVINNSASKELLSKNETLQRMIHKSNTMYAKLLEENQTLISSSNERIPSIDENTHPKKLVIKVTSSINLTESKSTEKQNIAKTVNTASPSKEQNESGKVMDTYLKKTLMQFFLQDEQTRESLIPLILELAGCTRQQIATAQRQWERTHQIVTKKTNFFGF